MDSLNLLAASSELLLAIGAMVLLMLGAFRLASDTAIYWIAVGLLLVAALIAGGAGQEALFGVFVSDAHSGFAKVFAYVASAAVLVMSREYLVRAGMAVFEFPSLVVLACAGMALMASANDMIALYVLDRLWRDPER